jgi:hypothetical protein
MTLALWLFPESSLVGTPEVDDYAGYLTLLAAVQADQERMGNEAVRVPLTVAEMRSELATRGWENTPDNRAAVVGLLYNRA